MGANKDQNTPDDPPPADSSQEPQVTSASIAISPDPGTSQNPHSIQVTTDASLTLKWATSNASGVRIEPLGEHGASGSQNIPTSDASYSIVPLGQGGIEGVAFQINVATHDPADVVSPHSDVSSGVAKLISFSATADGHPFISVPPGTQVTLTAVVSDAAKSVSINETEHPVSDAGDGNKTASTQISVQDPGDQEFKCSVLQGGNVQDSFSVTVTVEAEAPGKADPSPDTEPAPEPAEEPAPDPAAEPAPDP
jgi:hypothetical protein